jgi:hypothetical protein
MMGLLKQVTVEKLNNNQPLYNSSPRNIHLRLDMELLLMSNILSLVILSLVILSLVILRLVINSIRRLIISSNLAFNRIPLPHQRLNTDKLTARDPFQLVWHQFKPFQNISQI